MEVKLKRIEGLDFARALAILGMFIVNYTILTGAEGNGSRWLVTFIGLFEGRASALFVMLAGNRRFTYDKKGPFEKIT